MFVLPFQDQDGLKQEVVVVVPWKVVVSGFEMQRLGNSAYWGHFLRRNRVVV
jgi:hypothetical protein